MRRDIHSLAAAPPVPCSGGLHGYLAISTGKRFQQRIHMYLDFPDMHFFFHPRIIGACLVTSLVTTRV